MKFTSLFALTLVFAAGSAHAFDNPPGYKVDWSPCATEITKFKCTDALKRAEEDVYQCLLKHDEDLSKACDNGAHTKYEIATGKGKK